MFVKKFDHDLPVPSRATPGSAGYDLRSNEDIRLYVGQQHLFSTGYGWEGVAMHVWGEIKPRSGLAMKGIDTRAGVIDSDYHGEIKVLLINQGDRPVDIKKGDRIAQMITQTWCKLADEVIPGSDRDGGFGSTGA